MKRIDLRAFPYPIVESLVEVFDRWCQDRGMFLPRRSISILTEPMGKAELETVERFARYLKEMA